MKDKTSVVTCELTFEGLLVYCVLEDEDFSLLGGVLNYPLEDLGI